ncbi:VWA domain-containing protein [Amycolatopsis rhabdoformis]|uniref:VWA domain-containing protein n=1 Tax=Amycolatopsis rhabdoformis TaxID=1448059 RepID=A0ABZ1IFZ9_9PSEU|nr:VWA domain-containing protein [Amycolatopsis rhabdoformis]WSE33390.1 VWA domain-containing protein [Amycolatopsis rhabdoformis]
MAELTRVLTGFARALREAGLPVGSGDALTHCRAMTVLDTTDLADVYWGGRTTLLKRHEDLPRYDETFRRYFLGTDDPPPGLLTILAEQAADAAPALPGPEGTADERETDAPLGLSASDVDSLKRKAFSACTPEELAAIRRAVARLRLTPPSRRTRRTRPARKGGEPDLRRTIRAGLRTFGEPRALLWRERRVRLRPLILLLDVSGSMAAHSRTLLQFAYSAHRAAAKVEVFCFGTRLTRITAQLGTRDADEALARAAEAVVDWEGGTRIGAALDEFVRTHGRRGRCRGGVVVICSDGFDRGDPDVLARAVRRLSRLCHRLVWANPHGATGSLGMRIAAPCVDLLVTGHDLRSLEELAAALPRVR